MYTSLCVTPSLEAKCFALQPMEWQVSSMPYLQVLKLQSQCLKSMLVEGGQTVVVTEPSLYARTKSNIHSRDSTL